MRLYSCFKRAWSGLQETNAAMATWQACTLYYLSLFADNRNPHILIHVIPMYATSLGGQVPLQ